VAKIALKIVFKLKQFSHKLGPQLDKKEAPIPDATGSGHRGTSPIRKRPPPQDPPRTLGIRLR